MIRKIIVFTLIIAGVIYGINYAITTGALDRFLDSHPEWHWIPVFYYYLGEFYVIFAKWDKAIDRFKKIVEIYPDSDWADRAQFAIAKVYDDANNSGQAIKEYRKLIDLYPKSKYSRIAEKRIMVLR
ncbi:MAG: tetratricopeptide repeat protein [Elusimicrobiota bacterium]|nr:tetratricopeptide repeat protein [Elusimicrobiota bacterium]